MRDEAAASGLLEREEGLSKASRPVVGAWAAGTAAAGVLAAATRKAAVVAGMAVEAGDRSQPRQSTLS
jgi:hypothetical protein